MKIRNVRIELELMCKHQLNDVNSLLQALSNKVAKSSSKLLVYEARIAELEERYIKLIKIKEEDSAYRKSLISLVTHEKILTKKCIQNLCLSTAQTTMCRGPSVHDLLLFHLVGPIFPLKLFRVVMHLRV